MYKPMRVAGLISALAVSTASLASGVNGINNGMPNRISMNVTVPKQTQGAIFGEKVNSGLQTAGSALASGASLTIECGGSACVVALPDGSGYRAALDAMTIAPLEAAHCRVAASCPRPCPPSATLPEEAAVSPPPGHSPAARGRMARCVRGTTAARTR